MRPLRVTRYKQDPAHCWIAACSSVANFHNRKVDYNLAKHVAKKEVMSDISEGAYSGDSGLLLNNLGFRKVKIFTCDLENLDYSMAKMSKKGLIERLDMVVKSRHPDINPDKRGINQSFRNFLQKKSFSNQLVIDHHFSSHIREALDNGLPVLVSFNWNMYFEYPKAKEKKNPEFKDVISGYPEHHAVVARGYNDKYIHIVDSHWEYYKRKLSKFRKGYYTIPWEEFMTVMGMGDVIIPEDYEERRLNYELV